MLVFLMIDPSILIVEFKHLVLRPLIISSKDLFAKIAREDKSTETETSEAPMIILVVSPIIKKVKTDRSSIPIQGGTSQIVPLVAHGNDVDAKSSTFAHLLEDMLLPQAVDGHSSKSMEDILDEDKGHVFHVSCFSFMFLVVSFQSGNHFLM